MPTTTPSPRYVLEAGPSGPRVVDTIEPRVAPFSDSDIAREAAFDLNAGRPRPIIWVTPSYVADMDDRARATYRHGNG